MKLLKKKYLFIESYYILQYRILKRNVSSEKKRKMLSTPLMTVQNIA